MGFTPDLVGMGQGQSHLVGILRHISSSSFHPILETIQYQTHYEGKTFHCTACYGTKRRSKELKNLFLMSAEPPKITGYQYAAGQMPELYPVIN